jgi:hypothetical protein
MHILPVWTHALRCSLTKAASFMLGDKIGDFGQSVDELEHCGRTPMDDRSY